MEYCDMHHLWAGARTHLQLLDREEKRIKNLISQSLSDEELLPLHAFLRSLFYRITSVNAALHLVRVCSDP